jgi:hypothetical protein
VSESLSVFDPNGLRSNSLSSALMVLEQSPPQCLQRMELSYSLHSGTRSLRTLCSELISAAVLTSHGRDSLGMPMNMTSILRIQTSPESYLVLHIVSGGIRASTYRVQIHYGMCVGTSRIHGGLPSRSVLTMEEYATSAAERVGTTVVKWTEPPTLSEY